MLVRAVAVLMSLGAPAIAANVRGVVAGAGAAAHPAIEPVVPSLSMALTPALPAVIASPGLAAAASSPGAPPEGRALPVMSRDVARDEAAARLAEAGLPELLREHGLVLWHILRARTRSGERAFLTLSLPLDGRPFVRGADDPARKAELERRVAAAEKRIVAEVSRILEMPEDMIGVNTRLIESCCGAGCQSCLLTKEKHSERWTGLPPRPEGG